MLVDVGLATGTLGVLWFFGIPIVLLIGSPQKSGKGAVRCLHGAPFVGCAVIILISQTLFYVGIPVAHSVAFLWAAAVMGWVSLAIAGRLHHWRTPEWPLIPVLVCIYAVQALGLFMLGSQVYVGSGWHDQFNYVSTAELIADYSYGTRFSDIAGHPYLLAGVTFQADRIGQSVLQAFYMKSFGIAAKPAFEFVSLLGPALTAVAISWLCRELGLKQRIALLAAAVAGTMPAITLIHLECFLSQALGTPFLLAWPMMLATASQPQSGDPRKKFAWCLFGGLTAAAGWSIYTEYLPLYLAAWLVFIVAEFARRRWQTPSQPIPSFLWTVGTSIITIVLGFMLNPFYLPNIISFYLARPGLLPFGPENVLDSLYPWSGKIAGITHLWLGSLTIATGPLLRSIDAMALLLFGLGIASLVALSIRTRKSLGAVASALLAAPWVIGFGWKFGYIHYKALSSVSPLVPVGLACFEHSAWRAWPPVARFGSVLGRFALLVALAFSLAGTLNLTFRAGGGAGLTLQAMGRGGSFKLVDPAMRDVQHRLETRKGQTIYIAWFDDFFGGNFVNAWLVYFSRFNTVYAVNPRVGDADFMKAFGFDLTMHDPGSEFVVVASSQYPEFEQYLRSGDSPFHIYELPREAWPTMRQKFVTQLPGPKALVDTLR